MGFQWLEHFCWYSQNSLFDLDFDEEASKFNSPNFVISGAFFNPNGIVSNSPGLTRRGYPGNVRSYELNHNVVLSFWDHWLDRWGGSPCFTRSSQDRTALRFNLL